MTADEILAIPETEPERIFPNSEGESNAKWKELQKTWHPDINKSKDASKVSAHITKLYDSVIVKIQAGVWAPPKTLVLSGKDGKTRTIKYKRKRKFELGEMFYGDKVLCYVVEPAFADLFENAVKTIKKKFVYKNESMRNEMSKYLPDILDSFTTKDDRRILVIGKTPDVFLLQDVLDSLGGSIDPVHVAWIMSAMHNIACYLKYAGLTHNAISANTCFISPKFHSALLLGGWWHSAEIGKKLISLPKRSMKYAPHGLLADKIADPKLDLVMIRILGCEILGDEAGMSLRHNSKIPSAMSEFLMGHTDGDAVEDYRYWVNETLIESFGKRRFVEMKIEPSDIYKE